MADSFDLATHRLKQRLRGSLHRTGLLPFARRLKPWLRPLRRLLQAMRAFGLGRVVIGTGTLICDGPPFVEFLLRLLWLRWYCRRIPRTGRPVSEPRVVMLVVSHLPADPRVEREARALVAAGFRVTVICPMWWPISPPPDWGSKIEIRVLPEAAGTFAREFPHVLGKQLFRAAMAEDAWAYHAHDLNTAMVALAASARKKVPCLCDFHEWFSENVSNDPVDGVYKRHGWLTRWVFRRVEALAIRRATAVVTVCESIGQRLEREFHSPQPIHIVRNIPPLVPSEGRPADLRALLGISGEKKILLYQGGLGAARNLEPIIRAMVHVESAVLVIRGPLVESFASHYLGLARQAGSEGKVFCAEPVASAAVVREAAAADIGLWTLLSNVGLNFKLALPNKVFEYLAAGLPLLAADLPEVRRIIDTFQVGLRFDPDDPRDIARAIRTMAEDDAFRRRCRDNIAGALHSMEADREWQKLVTIYDRMRAGQLTPRTLSPRLTVTSPTRLVA